MLSICCRSRCFMKFVPPGTRSCSNQWGAASEVPWHNHLHDRSFLWRFHGFRWCVWVLLDKVMKSTNQLMGLLEISNRDFELKKSDDRFGDWRKRRLLAMTTASLESMDHLGPALSIIFHKTRFDDMKTGLDLFCSWILVLHHLAGAFIDVVVMDIWISPHLVAVFGNLWLWMICVFSVMQKHCQILCSGPCVRWSILADASRAILAGPELSQTPADWTRNPCSLKAAWSFDQNLLPFQFLELGQECPSQLFKKLTTIISWYCRSVDIRDAMFARQELRFAAQEFIVSVLWAFVSMDANVSATTCLASCGGTKGRQRKKHQKVMKSEEKQRHPVQSGL